jgi:two-component system sensor histidine kinase KdpD
VCDEALLSRAVVNVVSNAVLHDGAETDIVVSITGTPQCPEIRVIDHGRGIPVDERAQALQPFSQVGSRADGGAGAGLSIAEAFMRAMGGALEMSDTPGGGLTVTLSLPPQARA